MPLPVESHVLAVCQEIVHTIIETNEVERIGKGPLSITTIRRQCERVKGHQDNINPEDC